jgi:branched-chain amino acid transport system ATP-binding protein
MLELLNIQSGYGKRLILKGVSARFEAGKIYAILGPNGAGKSTLLKTIIGLLPLKGGEILLDNDDISSLPSHLRVKKGIAYFMQGGQVFPSLSVEENLEIGACRISKDEYNRVREEIYEMFPILKEKRKLSAGLLSGGQRQQLALAMVLFKKPKVLLLDEPSAGLSPDLLPQLMNTIYRLNKSLKAAVLLVEQNPRFALQIADSALVLLDGEIKSIIEEPNQLLQAKDWGSISKKIYERSDER